MSLFDTGPGERRRWARVGDYYTVTKKPRNLDLSSFETIPFVPMDAIPQGGAYAPTFTPKSTSAIASGTYFERGDILLAKITPSFENGKQALTLDLTEPFGYATTEVVPLQPHNTGYDRRLLFFYLLHPDIRHHVTERMEGSTGRKRVPASVILDLHFPVFEPEEQEAICDSLELIQKRKLAEIKSEQATKALKTSVMQTLFTRGLRGQPQKETEIGHVPENWRVGRLGQFANIISSRMAYTELQKLRQPVGKNVVKVLGVKVADMNLPGNEVKLQTAILERMVDKATAEYRCAPPRTIIFPKRGAAIATNKKRISIEWTAFDPNVIGIVAENELDQDFLFQWFQMFDLRTITDDGPTPQLNKKNLLPLNIPVPPSLVEQREIVAILDSIDQRIELHRRKRAVLDELFKALLHKLMTGEIRVGELDLSAIGEAGGLVQEGLCRGSHKPTSLHALRRLAPGMR